MNIYAPHACSVCGGQNRGMDPKGLELGLPCGCQVVLGMEPRSWERTVSAFTTGHSLQPKNLFSF